MKTNKRSNVILTKDTPFEVVLDSVMPMIKSIGRETNGVYGVEREDLEQELSLQVYKSWQSWKPDGGTKFSTYVYDALMKRKNFIVRTAKAQRRNCGQSPASLDEMRTGSQSTTEEFRLYDVLTEEDSCDPETYAYIREIQGILEEVLGTLRERSQEVVRGILEGYTQQEVSEMTGVTQSLVSYHLNLFRQKLRQELERRDFDLPFAGKYK